MRWDRLRVHLDYGNTQDTYEWQIFYPDEIAALALRGGFCELLRCANFDESSLPNPDIPRMQFVWTR